MNSVLPTVMLVEGSLPPCNFLRVSLREGALYNEAGEPLAGLSSIAEHSPDAIILDIGAPDKNSWAYAQEMNEWFAGPVIIITNTPRATNLRPNGSVASDNSTSSLAAAEYQARKRVTQRLAQAPLATPSVYQIEKLRVDLEERTVTLAGREVRLTPSEFRLLTLMIQNAGKVLSHAFLLEAVWGAERTDDIQSLRVYMSSLRRKIEVNAAEPRYLLTIQGIGYRLRKA